MSTNEIQKQILLKASIERVWDAVTKTQAFGKWFGMKLEGEFRAGEVIRGIMTPTQMDDEIAKMQEPFSGKPVELHVQRIIHQELFSFKWHLYVDEKTPLSESPMTLVTFRLEQKPEGVLLTITESGFDQVPLTLRKQAFEGNSEGWNIQARLIATYLEKHGA